MAKKSILRPFLHGRELGTRKFFPVRESGTQIAELGWHRSFLDVGLVGHLPGRFDMKFSRLLPAAIATAALLLAVAGHAAPPTDVVYGNLGSTGGGALSTTNTDILPVATGEGDTSALAQGFTTGSSAQFLTLQSVVLGLFAEPGVPARTVSLFSDAAGVPGSELAVSNAVSISSQAKYTFSFSSLQLSPNTSYWIVPQSDVSWYVNSTFTAPGAQNTSGYSYLGTAAKTFESAGSWEATGLTSYSLSVTAVPEPSTYALAAIGVAAGGLMRWRRRIAAR